MIKTLEVVNSYGDTPLSIDLRNPETSGYVISGINGLGPVNVDIKQTQMVSGLKYRYNKGFHKYREITIQFIFYEWNKAGVSSSQLTIDELRLNLMNQFKTNDLITLYFTKDTGDIRKIQGWVSKHEPTYFSDSCGAQVVVTCPDPWFIGVTGTSPVNYNEYFRELVANSYSEVDNMYVYSKLINYSGSIESGFRIEFLGDVISTRGTKININSSHNSDETGKIYLYEPQNYSPGFEEYDEYKRVILKNPAYTNGYTNNSQTVYATTHVYLPGGSTRRDTNTNINLYAGPDNSEYIWANDNYDINVNFYTGGGSTLQDFVFNVNINHYGLMFFNMVKDFLNDSILGNPNYSPNTINICTKNPPNSSEVGNNIPISSMIVGDGLESKLNIDTSTDYLSVNVVSDNDPTKKLNVAGWIDSNTISKRQPLPCLNKGNNTIIIQSSKALNDSSGAVAAIYYRNLYRGI